MASILKVDTIQDQSGNNIINENADTITIGASGDTINVVGTLQNNGAAVGGTNTPAFMATLSSAQNVSDNTNTKVSANTVLFDTDSAYDNSTNYRFTPQTAGKYFVFGSVFCDPQTASDLVYGRAYLYKNGSQVKATTIDFRNTAGREVVVSVSVIVDMNGSTDYVELFGNVNASDGAGMRFGATDSFWGAYKIIE
jgi:hypothetical protein